MRMVNLTNASSVKDPQYGEAHAGDDGVFDLPQPFAEHLLRTAAGMWRTEADHVALLARQELEELRDPAVALKVLADLRATVARQEARIAELETQAAAGADATAQSDPPQDPTAEKEPEPAPAPATTPKPAAKKATTPRKDTAAKAPAASKQ